jgi:tetratricopeptide (TPR) repeat protein
VPTDLAGAEAALARGSYAVARRAIDALLAASGPADVARARLLSARWSMETGAYADAVDAAARAAAEPALRVVAETLRAEALAAMGKEDDAERVLRTLAGERAAHRARVLLGELLVSRSRRAEAEPFLMALVEAYNDETIGDRDAEGLALVARAARALGSFQDANDAFRASVRADPSRVETQLDWAELFLEKYDAGHAEECVRDALAVNPKSPRAHALAARIALEQGFDFERARRHCDQALSVNPHLVACHVTRAGMALRDMDLALAERHVRTALAVDPVDLEALGVLGAVRFLADDPRGFERTRDEVLRRSPRYARFYGIVATYADWEHRYPEVVEMARAAIALDPSDARAHATLGINLLRMGEEREGLAALREAWRRDRYDVQVYNLLNLYDDVISRDYVDVRGEPITYRMHREERVVLEPYVVPVMGRAYQDMRRRYGFTPDGPLRIELFASPAHFGVRTTGLPNVGVQGVCFGKVVTAISPRGGPFNWGNVLWHELAHVFHIQQSRNRVPRWFTEGLAEYESIVARPEWRREDDASLWIALETGTLPPLQDMNKAFTHTRRASDVLTAYYASSRIVAYVVERFGFDVVPRMLRAWGEGRRTPEVISSVLGLSIDELDRDFRDHTRQRLGARRGHVDIDPARFRDLPALRAAVAARPRDAAALAALAGGLLVAGDVEAAKRTALEAMAIDAREPIARFLLAELSLGAGDARGALEHARAVLATGRDGYDLRLLAAGAALRMRDSAEARRQLEAAVHLDGDRPEAWRGLRQIARESGDEALLLTSLERLARIDQHDRETYAALAERLYSAERWADLVAHGEAALFVDPAWPEHHRFLGEAYVRTGRAREGLVELDQALRLSPERPALVHLGRARALTALGRIAAARRAADEAVRIDPGLADVARQALAAPRAR